MSRRAKLPPIVQGWREQAARRRRTDVIDKAGDRGPIGMCFQLPKDWDDGSGKIRHCQEGIFKGRVIFSSRHEAKEIAKRWEDTQGRSVQYDP